MQRNEYGVWEVGLPAKDGQMAIPHNSKVKVRLSRQYSTRMGLRGPLQT